MMIEDKELSNLFRVETDEHLQKIENGLLRLEKKPGDSATLEELFREVHSLKGAARILGLTDIQTMSHHIEGILGDAKKGLTVISPQVINRIYRALDAIRKLANEAMAGTPSGIVVTDLLAQLQQETEVVTEQGAQGKDLRPEITCPAVKVSEEMPATEREVKSPVPESKIPEQKYEIETFRIETVRVETEKLDALMTQSGELSVAKIGIAQRLAVIDEIVESWEALGKRNSELGLSVLELKSTIKSPQFSVENLVRFHNNEQKEIDHIGVLLDKLRNVAYEDTSKLDFIANEMEHEIRNIRLLPLSTIFNLFPRMVRDIAQEQSKEVGFVILGGDTTADKRIIEEMKDPLMHIIRNAIDHGIELPREREQAGKPRTGSVSLRAYKTATSVVIELKDDGRGLNIEAIKRTAVKQKICREEELAAMPQGQIQSLIFTAGFSTSQFISDISGRGIGLNVVRTNVERLKGTVQVESSPTIGCTFRIQLPVTLATIRTLIVAVSGMKYAIPVEYVQTTCHVSPGEIFTTEGRQAVTLDGNPVSVAELSDLLELRKPEKFSLSKSEPRDSKSKVAIFPCIVLLVNGESLGVFVDALLDEQEIVLKQQSVILKRLRNVSGVTILGTGEVCMVLNPRDMIKTIRSLHAPVTAEKPSVEMKKKMSVLLAEDSITTRTQMKRILEGDGYEVVAAVDGVDAFSKLGARSFDALVTDIMMPNMDGLTLTAKVREDKRYKEMPVILVTSLSSDADRKKGMEAGANAYITKPAFDQKALLDTLKRLI